MSDFFAANRENRAAIGEALSALAGMRAEFTERGSADEHWFFDLTCEVVYLDFLLHELLARIEGEKDAWSMRLDARLLGIHTLTTIDRISAATTKTLEKRIGALTDNPAIVDPLTAVVREFATFRRLNDKVIRSTRRELGMEERAERPWALAEVDHQAVAALALAMVRWLSEFGKAATLLISAIRAHHARAAGNVPTAPPPTPPPREPPNHGGPSDGQEGSAPGPRPGG